MREWLPTLITALASVMLCLALMAGCEKKDTAEETNVTRQTEVNDRLLGGKEVKETEVKQQGDKVQVKEKETEIDRHGNVEEKETTIKGDKID